MKIGKIFLFVTLQVGDHQVGCLFILVVVIYYYFYYLELTRVVHKLDERAGQKHPVVGGFRGFERKKGEPSKTPPPSGAPSWTIDSTATSSSSSSATAITPGQSSS